MCMNNPTSEQQGPLNEIWSNSIHIIQVIILAYRIYDRFIHQWSELLKDVYLICKSSTTQLFTYINLFLIVGGYGYFTIQCYV